MRIEISNNNVKLFAGNEFVTCKVEIQKYRKRKFNQKRSWRTPVCYSSNQNIKIASLVIWSNLSH